MISGLAGFGLSLILGRTVGPEGNGVVFQMISVFMIASAVAKLGLDTTCVWLLPRLASDRRQDVRRATALLLVGALGGGLAAGLAVFVLAPWLSPQNPDLLILMQVSAAFVPVASVGTVALAVTRGLGGIRPYVLIGSIGLPSARLAGVAVAVAIAASALMAGLMWLALLSITTAASLIAVRGRLRPFESPGSTSATPSSLARRISAYSTPRLASSVMEQAILWQDVLIVGLVTGPVGAGIYGVVSRLAQAGFIPSTSMRIVVGPQFSRMLHRGQASELAEFYGRTTQWIVLMSAPVYVLLVVNARAVLGIFGNGFEVGADALVVASIGGLIWTSAGNVQSLLLMSGRSGWAALNKLCVMIVSICLLVALVPAWGILGAALSWTIAMSLDVCLAVIVVRRGVGIRLDLGLTLLALASALISTATPAMIARMILGETAMALIVGTVGAGVVYVITMYLLRERFALHHAIAVFARRPGGRV